MQFFFAWDWEASLNLIFQRSPLGYLAEKVDKISQEEAEIGPRTSLFLRTEDWSQLFLAAFNFHHHSPCDSEHLLVLACFGEWKDSSGIKYWICNSALNCGVFCALWAWFIKLREHQRPHKERLYCFSCSKTGKGRCWLFNLSSLPAE